MHRPISSHANRLLSRNGVHQVLKKEKETLALNYEQEEEYLTNDLSRKLNQLREEKVQLEKTLEEEQNVLVNKLMRKIKKLEGETTEKQLNLERLRHEKINLENTLEQEQVGGRCLESNLKFSVLATNPLVSLSLALSHPSPILSSPKESLVNKLWKRMDKLENEKRNLQEKLEEFNNSPVNNKT